MVLYFDYVQSAGTMIGVNASKKNTTQVGLNRSRRRNSIVQVIGMADLFNKHIKKATSRTKERLLEGIGKSKPTQDEAFDNHAANLNKQSKACERLHKDLKIYATALKTLCQAEKTLRDTIRDSYEPEWPEKEYLTALLDNLDIQTNEMENIVCDSLMLSVTQYVAQFADLKKKVEKRGRKLVDYDGAKHSFNSAKASKKSDGDPKVAKAYTELQNAEMMYKEMNNELLEVLPATYDSRITFYVDTLQTLFNTQNMYYSESSKISKQVVTQLDKLGESMDSLRVPRIEARPLTPIDDTSRQSTPSPHPSPAPAAAASAASDTAAAALTPQAAAREPSTGGSNPFDDDDEGESAKVEEEEVIVSKVYPKLTAAPRQNSPGKEVRPPKEKDSSNPFDDDEDEEEKEEANALDGVTSEPRPLAYMVKSTHEYKATDTDELTFSAGEVIKVLESKAEDQLDDGWCLGEKEDGTRGVFPENFTKKVK